ncbi:MAG: hypothetical protein K2H50_03105 [Paramuribaculum sp.]|nr:hypothetical protein [Paramuribaculum sp.]
MPGECAPESAIAGRIGEGRALQARLIYKPGGLLILLRARNGALPKPPTPDVLNFTPA